MIAYTSSDIGARQLVNTNNSLNLVLNDVLVMGYGDKPAAGWSAPFTGTNLFVFKQGIGGNDRYFRFFDGGIDASGYRCTRFRGYESMTAVSTGTGAFPTTGQIAANGINFTYYNSAATAPRWFIFADSRVCHVIIDTYDISGYWEYCCFGSGIPTKQGSQYFDFVIGSDPIYSGGYNGQVIGVTQAPTANSGVYISRNDTGTGSAKLAGLVSPYAGFMTSHSVGPCAYPDRPTNSVIQAQTKLTTDGYDQGTIPGLWQVLHNPDTMGHDIVGGTTWSGAIGSELEGRTFKMFGPFAIISQGTYPKIVIETSDTWS